MPVLVAYSCGDEFCVMKTPSATHKANLAKLEEQLAPLLDELAL